MMTARSTIPVAPDSYMMHIALQAEAMGLSVLPIRADGSKQPALVGWKQYQQRRASQQELWRWFGDPTVGIALITGKISGNLEALDFDSPRAYTAWLACIRRDPVLSALYERVSWGYLEGTPAEGKHLLYRCSQIAGNLKLARKPTDGPERYKTLIETRGEGGLIIIAPSRGSVHPSGKPYMLLRGGVASIQMITPQERERLLASACALDEPLPAAPHTVSPRQARPPGASVPLPGAGLRPGDLFNQQASWEAVLVPHGWELVRMVGEEGQWRKPGKQGSGISATTNWQGSDLLYVFSTSTAFEPEHGYSKFAAYVLLNHQGDFAAAARALREQGYSPDRIK